MFGGRREDPELRARAEEHRRRQCEMQFGTIREIVIAQMERGADTERRVGDLNARVAALERIIGRLEDKAAEAAMAGILAEDAERPMEQVLEEHGMPSPEREDEEGERDRWTRRSTRRRERSSRRVPSAGGGRDTRWRRARRAPTGGWPASAPP